MKNNKFILAVIIGTVVSFLLGWVIYGILLKSTMDANCGLPKELHEKVFRQTDKPDPMTLVTILISNFFGAVLLTTIAVWANARTIASGAKVGALVGALMALNFDLLWYSMSYLFTPTEIAIDVCAALVMTSITTAVIALILGKGKVTN